MDCQTLVNESSVGLIQNHNQILIRPARRAEVRASDSPRPQASQHAIETAFRLHLEALDAREAGRPAEAAPLALRALEILEREDAPQIDIASVLYALARIQEDLGHLASAEVSIHRALGILERLRDLGDDPTRARLETRAFGLLSRLKRG